MPSKIKKAFHNQRGIVINQSPCGNGYLYATLNVQALECAMKNLTSQYGIKLWLYLAKNQNGYAFALSKADFCEKANCSAKGYRTAFKDLVDNCFLVGRGQPIKLKESDDDFDEYEDWDFNAWGNAEIYQNYKGKKEINSFSSNPIGF